MFYPCDTLPSCWSISFHRFPSFSKNFVWERERKRKPLMHHSCCDRRMDRLRTVKVPRSYSTRRLFCGGKKKKEANKKCVAKNWWWKITNPHSSIQPRTIERTDWSLFNSKKKLNWCTECKKMLWDCSLLSPITGRHSYCSASEVLHFD